MQLPCALHDRWQICQCDAGPSQQSFGLRWQLKKLKKACRQLCQCQGPAAHGENQRPISRKICCFDYQVCVS